MEHIAKMEQIHRLIEKYSKIENWTKVSVLEELLYKLTFYGINDTILKLKLEYSEFGLLDKVVVLEELEELL